MRDGTARLEEERELAAADAKRADESGRAEAQRASSVAAQPLNSDFNARLNGLDPQSPYVTQRTQSRYFWYKTSEGDIERRDPGNELVQVDRVERERVSSHGPPSSLSPFTNLSPAIGTSSLAWQVDLTLSCAKFRSDAWVAANRPEWPPALRDAVGQYAAAVPQQAVVMPPKGSAPSKGEVTFDYDAAPKCDPSRGVCDDSYVSVWRRFKQ